jgi:flagellar basal body-associated protein FliL
MGKFDWFSKIGATPEAVAVLNDQPFLFTILIVVIVAIAAQFGVIYAIHFMTMKEEQKKAKADAKKKKADAKAAKSTPAK